MALLQCVLSGVPIFFCLPFLHSYIPLKAMGEPSGPHC